MTRSLNKWKNEKEEWNQSGLLKKYYNNWKEIMLKKEWRNIDRRGNMNELMNEWMITWTKKERESKQDIKIEKQKIKERIKHRENGCDSERKKGI